MWTVKYHLLMLRGLYNRAFNEIHMEKRNAVCVLFGETVRALRKAQGFSQEEFADHAGIHRTYMGGIERGERNPTLTTISRIADALGVPISELFIGKNHA